MDTILQTTTTMPMMETAMGRTLQELLAAQMMEGELLELRQMLQLCLSEYSGMMAMDIHLTSLLGFIGPQTMALT